MSNRKLQIEVKRRKLTSEADPPASLTMLPESPRTIMVKRNWTARMGSSTFPRVSERAMMLYEDGQVAMLRSCCCDKRSMN